MSANFDPSMGNYKNMTPFKMWCQKVLPQTYDDSLSYYEVLCKLKNHLNEVIENMDVLHADVDALHIAYQQLEGYVNDYFDNLSVQTEINNKLDDMAEDGSLSELIEPFVEALLPEEVADRIESVVALQLGAVVAQQLGAVVGEQLPNEVAEQVPTMVSAWLNEHVNPESEVVIDDSLTIQGAAADAKAAGDAIGELKSALSHVALTDLTPVATIENKYCTISGNHIYYSSVNGCNYNKYNVSALVGDSVYVTSKRISGNYKMFYLILGSDDYTVLDSYQADSTTITSKDVTIPSNASYMYVNYYATDDTCNAQYYEVISEVKEELETQIGDINDNIYLYQESELTPEHTYNDLYIDVTGGGSVRSTTVSGNTAKTFDLSGLENGDKIKITTELLDASHAYCYVITRTDLPVLYLNDASNLSYTDYEIPFDSSFLTLYINCDSNETSSAVFVTKENITDVYEELTKDDRIKGKKCVCFGDSITWYDGHAYNWGAEQGITAKGYESYLREAGMIVDNQGYSGATLKATYTSKIANYDFTGCDYVTLTSGANDARYMYPIGEIAEVGSTYADTFIGWLQTSIDHILTQNSEVKLMLMTPIKGWIYTPDGYNVHTPPEEDGIISPEYAQAIRDVANFYSLPYCDWYNDSGLNIHTRPWYINDPEPDKSATPNPNVLYSLHPSTKGYKRMADVLLPVIKSI